MHVGLQPSIFCCHNNGFLTYYIWVVEVVRSFVSSGNGGFNPEESDTCMRDCISFFDSNNLIYFFYLFCSRLFQKWKTACGLRWPKFKSREIRGTDLLIRQGSLLKVGRLYLPLEKVPPGSNRQATCILKNNDDDVKGWIFLNEV